jgi:alkaline phosphatase D
MPKLLAVILSTVGLVLTAGGTGTAPPAPARTAPTDTHGVIVGDVTSTAALVWARADREATLHLALSGGRRLPHD